jgi:hypothetical protein
MNPFRGTPDRLLQRPVPGHEDRPGIRRFSRGSRDHGYIRGGVPADQIFASAQAQAELRIEEEDPVPLVEVLEARLPLDREDDLDVFAGILYPKI